MSSKFQLRLCVLLASAVVALLVWKWIPGTVMDRIAFTSVASGSANGPLFISGAGTYGEPWKLQTFSSHARPDHRQAPIIVALGDDLSGFFQSNPPAPIDLAVIFSNFQRLGAEKAATAAVFAWEKPDPIGLAAFEKSLAGFDSLVMALPLSRGVVATQMPPTLRRASIPAERVQGNLSALPLVNRLPIPGIILGGETTIAGFSVLESETASPLLPLVARWDDRVVFSFPLLTVLQRLDLPVDGVEVRLGEYLKLGPSGPIIPIDEVGRLTMPIKPISPYAEISAEALIDGGDDLFPKQAPDPVILRDDQSAAEPATREFSRGLSAAIAIIASSGGLTPAAEFRRISEGWEILFLLGSVLILTVLCGQSRFKKHLGIAVMLGLVLTTQWVAFGFASAWLPGLPIVGAILAAILVAAGFEKWKAPRPVSISELVPTRQPPTPQSILSGPLVETPPKADPGAKDPTSKKAPVRKTTAKKAAAKRATAKKAATKKAESPPKTPRKKTPPAET